MNNTKNNGNNNSDNSGQQLTMIGLLAVAAVIWKNEGAIRFWFYNNIMSLVLVALLILAALGFWLWSRFKKNEEEYFDRRRKLRQVETNQSNINYYQRKGPFDDKNTHR